MNEQQQEKATSDAKALAAACEAVLGRPVDWATTGYEGPSPSLRVLSIAAILIPLALLFVLPPAIGVLLVVLTAGAVVALGSTLWTTRIVAFDGDEVLVLERAGRAPSATVVATTSASPTVEKDVWRGYEIEGTTTWISKLALEARDATSAVPAA